MSYFGLVASHLHNFAARPDIQIHPIYQAIRRRDASISRTMKEKSHPKGQKWGIRAPSRRRQGLKRCWLVGRKSKSCWLLNWVTSSMVIAWWSSLTLHHSNYPGSCGWCSSHTTGKAWDTVPCKSLPASQSTRQAGIYLSHDWVQQVGMVEPPTCIADFVARQSWYPFLLKIRKFSLLEHLSPFSQ